jgi:hypothetical protein
MRLDLMALIIMAAAATVVIIVAVGALLIEIGVL